MKSLFVFLVLIFSFYSTYSQDNKIAVYKEGGKDTAYFDKIIINDGHKRMSESDYFFESAIKTTDKREKLNLLDTAISLYHNDNINIYHKEELYNERGRTEKGLGEINEAVIDYNIAISINPNYAKPYNNKGNIYSELNQFDSAIIFYNRAISLAPNDPYAYNGLGAIYARSEKYSEAISVFKKAINVESSYATSYFNLGLAYKDSHNDDSAIYFYSIAIDKTPDYLDAIYYRGKSYSNVKKYYLAIEDFSKLISLNNNDYKAYFNRGSAYYFDRKLVEAQLDFEKCLSISSSDEIKSKTFFMIAQNYASQNKIEDAKNALHNALRLNPDLIVAKKMLNEISK